MGIETQGVDYNAVLADLEARRDQIDSAIAVIRSLITTGVTSTPPVELKSSFKAPAATNEDVSIHSDTFFGLSIPDATKKFLAMRKRPVSPADIVAALKAGGQVNATASDNFDRTLSSVLYRVSTTNGGIVRVSRGNWGLSEWYPNKSRKTAPKDELPADTDS